MLLKCLRNMIRTPFKLIFNSLFPLQIFIMIVVLFQMSLPPHTCKPPGLQNISCLFLSPRNDVLMPYDEREVNKDVHNQMKRDGNVIFFHETSCRGGLTIRQACSVESAALTHSNWTVYLLMAAPTPAGQLDGVTYLLTQYIPNVKIRRVKLLDYVRGTPLEDLVNRLNRNSCSYAHIADILRPATMYKHSGMALDLDVVVARELLPLGTNFAVRQNAETVSSAVLALSGDQVGRKLAKAIAEEVAATFSQQTLHHNGPHAVTRVINRVCKAPDGCQGFQIHGPEVSSPIRLYNSRLYFYSNRMEPLERNTSLMFHFYDQYTHCFTSMEDSAFAFIGQSYCPYTFYSYTEHFVNIMGEPELTSD